MRSGEDWTGETAAEAERAIGYKFQNQELLKRCFTHSTYANASGEQSNQRLEFLGDAVLGLCVSENLFVNYRSYSEGDLTAVRQKYVSEGPLTESEKKAGLMRFLRFSGGEENVGGKTPSDLFEAVVAGIYLDGGLTEAKKFAERFLVWKNDGNFKSKLQELVQARAHETPVYTDREENGTFICTVSALGISAEGVGRNKKEAEKAAAETLYQRLAREKD